MSLSKPAPIVSRGLAEEVCARLRERIFSGQLRHGQRLVERDLAEELGVSRGPIRDALRLLESEGLVITTPRRGTRVASLRRGDAIEMLAIREALEPVAVRFLLEQHDPARFARLEETIARLEQAARDHDWSAAILLDLEFHGLIFELSGQRRLQRIWESLRVPMLQVFGELSHFYESIDDVPRRHRALLESLRSGDLQCAIEHSTDHAVAWRDRLLKGIEHEEADAALREEEIATSG